MLKLPHSPVTCEGDLSIIRLSHRYDTLLFHMTNEVDILDTTAVNFRMPTVFCSDVESVRKTIPNVENTEKWASMVIHEFFHQYEFNHEPTLKHFDELYLQHLYINRDSLQRICQSTSWFNEIVRQENDLLLQALRIKNLSQKEQLLRDFIDLRKQRRKRFLSETRFNIGPIEDYWEKNEGSARYVEWKLLNCIVEMPLQKKLKRVDLYYHVSDNHAIVDLEREGWLYDTRQSSMYFYATGFNLLRVLDQLNIEYKNHFFDTPQSNGTTLLSQHYKVE